jgi:hypothetical protein
MVWRVIDGLGRGWLPAFRKKSADTPVIPGSGQRGNFRRTGSVDFAGGFCEFVEGDDAAEDGVEDDGGVLGGVDVGDPFTRVEVEHGFAFFLVGADAAFDGFVAGVIEAVFLEGALADAAVEFLTVRAGKVEDVEHVDEGFHEAGLFDVAGDAIEHEKVDIGLEEVHFGTGVDIGLPELDGEFVGDEFASAGVFDEFLA